MALMSRTDTLETALATAQARGDQYVTRVNQGRLDVERHTDMLNRVFRLGFRLHSIFEQAGNTVMVFERYLPAPPPAR